MLQQLVGSQQGKYGPAAAVVKFVGLPLAVHELVQVLALGVAVEVEPADQLVLSVDVQVELAAAEVFAAREASVVLEAFCVPEVSVVPEVFAVPEASAVPRDVWRGGRKQRTMLLLLCRIRQS